MEKSYSKAERKNVGNYSVEILYSDNSLKLFWDYTIRQRRSKYSDVIRVDENNHKLDRGNEWDAWSYKATFKKDKIKRSLSYGTTMQTVGAYLDYQLFSLSFDKKLLTIESVFRSAKRFDHQNTQTNKLVFVRQS